MAKNPRRNHDDPKDDWRTNQSWVEHPNPTPLTCHVRMPNRKGEERKSGKQIRRSTTYRFIPMSEEHGSETKSSG
jgi:hypothetical protein